MIKQENPHIEKAVEILEDLSQDEQTRLLYEQRDCAMSNAIRDYNSCMEGSFEKGILEGKIETAQKLKNLRFETEIIQKATGLSLEQIEIII